MSRHGVDTIRTDAEYRAMILMAYHDVTCPDGASCAVRDRHSSEMIGNYLTLKRFLQRLTDIEVEMDDGAL